MSERSLPQYMENAALNKGLRSSDSQESLHFGLDLDAALAVFKRGDLHGARQAYLDLLSKHGEHPEINTQLGLIEGELNMIPSATQRFERALQSSPSILSAWTGLALCRQNLKQNKAALSAWQAAVDLLESESAENLNEQEKSVYADCLSRALQCELESKNLESALVRALKLHRLKPNDWVRAVVAELSLELGELTQAQSFIETALSRSPGEAQLYALRAQLIDKLAALRLPYSGQSQDFDYFQAALSNFEHALHINPKAGQCYALMGNYLSKNYLWSKAASSYECAVQLDATDVLSLNNLIVAYQYAGVGSRLTYAADLIDAALGSSSNNFKNKNLDETTFLFNAGALFFLNFDFQKARIFFEKALLINPYHAQLLGFYVHLRMHECDWVSVCELGPCDQVGRTRTLTFNALKQLLLEEVVAGNVVLNPFSLLSITDDPFTHLQASKHWAIKINSQCTHIKPFSKSSINRVLNSLSAGLAKSSKIRIGYFSNDFCEHATAFLMARLFELHDKHRFEIFVYSWSKQDSSAVRARIKACVDHWHEVGEMSDEGLIDFARSHELDFAIDLKGYTNGSRPAVFTARVALNQISYLGYPGTTGCDAIDFVIADPVVIPTSDAAHFSEQVLYTSTAYQVNDAYGATLITQVLRDNSAVRSEHHLPENAIVLCSFNSAYKITSEMFACWMQVLRDNPSAVLWILAENAVSVMHLQSQAINMGVELGRIIFAPKLAHAKHLQRLCLADLFLDTFPCNAHTSASDALRCGVPLITLQGKSFASRVASSLLNSVGLQSLVVQSIEAYSQRVNELMKEPRLLRSMQFNLRTLGSNDSLPLFDTPLFMKDYEQLLIDVAKGRIVKNKGTKLNAN